MDFLYIDKITLKRIYVFVGVEHAARWVHLLGLTRHPTGIWVTRQARNLSMNLPMPFRFVVRDRDAKYTAGFDAVFTAEGGEVIRTPVRAPRANAICQRWIGTLRRECTDRLLIYSERHLRLVLEEYLSHCNQHRPHRALERRSPSSPAIRPGAVAGARIRQRRVLGGPINEYESAA